MTATTFILAPALCLAALTPAMFIPNAVGAQENPAPAETVAEMPADPATEKALANPHVIMVRNIYRNELEPGDTIWSEGNAYIGRIAQVRSQDIVVNDGKADYLVPLVQLYAYRIDGKDYFASRVPKAKLARTTRLNETPALSIAN